MCNNSDLKNELKSYIKLSSDFITANNLLNQCNNTTALKAQLQTKQYLKINSVLSLLKKQCDRDSQACSLKKSFAELTDLSEQFIPDSYEQFKSREYLMMSANLIELSLKQNDYQSAINTVQGFVQLVRYRAW